MQATTEQIEARKEALELPVGYVDRATDWWTDWLTDEKMIHHVKYEILSALWVEFDRAVERPVWTYPVELIAQLDSIAAMVNKEPLLGRVKQAKEAIANYAGP